MLILPVLWQSLATLATVLLVTIGNGVTVFVEHSYKPLHATIGHGSTWFRQTIGEVYSVSIWSSNVPGMNTGSFYYIPPPVIDPYLVDLTLLSSHVSPLDDEAVDEEGPVARFEWFALDEDEPPVKIMRFKPAEHVSIPLVYRIRSASIRLLGFDATPTLCHGYLYATMLFISCILLGQVGYLWFLMQRQRGEEYWRFFDYAREFFWQLDWFVGGVVIPPPEAYYL